MSVRGLALRATLPLLLSSCFLLPHGSFRELPPAPARPMGPGDHVTVRDLAAPTSSLYAGVVADDGTLDLPGLGPFPVLGYTAQDLVAVLCSLEEHPGRQLAVEIAAPDRAVYVYGEIARPGHTPLRGDTTLVDVVLAAGPRGESADLTRVQLLRGDVLELAVDLREILDGGHGPMNVELQDGDVVLVPPALWELTRDGLYLYGEVRGAGYRPLGGEVTVTEAVIDGRPREHSADLSRVRVLRGGGEPQDIRVDVVRTLAGGTYAPRVMLERGDVVLVPPSVLVP